MMRMIIAAALLGAGLAAGTGAARAKPETYTLPDETATLTPGHGPGFEAAQNNCSACHSVDYINTQPPKLGHVFWQGEVQKMIKVYHASIDEADAKAIAEYLGQAY